MSRSLIDIGQGSCPPVWYNGQAKSSEIIPGWCVALRLKQGHRGEVLSERTAGNIKRAREARGWSQAVLAKKVVPPTVYQQIDKLETGERRLTLDWVERVAEALGIAPLELMSEQATTWQSMLSEPVAKEVGRSLARVVLDGAEPSRGTVEALGLMLVAFAGVFRRYPQALHDPEIAKPILELVAQRSENGAH